MKHREEKFEGEVGKVFTLCSEGDEVSEWRKEGEMFVFRHVMGWWLCST